MESYLACVHVGILGQYSSDCGFFYSRHPSRVLAANSREFATLVHCEEVILQVMIFLARCIMYEVS
jgi:hypothetical protein